MTDPLLTAHSLAELYLYITVNPCPDCGGGYEYDEPERTSKEGEELRLSLRLRCSRCPRQEVLQFRLPAGTATNAPDQTATINPTDEPSTIIDVAQWITLFRTFVERAAQEPDKVRARHMGLEAAQCLDEAIKFYDDPDSDLPPPDALFHRDSRERMREHPEQFSRERLLNLRAKLPTTTAMRERIESPPKLRSGKRWPWSR